MGAEKKVTSRPPIDPLTADEGSPLDLHSKLIPGAAFSSLLTFFFGSLWIGPLLRLYVRLQAPGLPCRCCCLRVPTSVKRAPHQHRNKARKDKQKAAEIRSPTRQPGAAIVFFWPLGKCLSSNPGPVRGPAFEKEPHQTSYGGGGGSFASLSALLS